MYKEKIKYSLLVLIFLVSAAMGQSRVFTLEQAIETALKNNREIKIAEMEVEKSQAAVDEAFGYALPSLDVSANFSRFLEKPKTPFPDFQSLLGNAVYGILFDEKLLPFDKTKFKPLESKLQSFAQSNNYSATAQVTQILFNSAVFRGIGASEIYHNLSQEQLKGTVAKTILNVKKAFFGVLLSKELVSITKTRLQNAQENLANVKALHQKGLVSDFDKMQVEVQVENIKPKLKELENILETAKDGLKIALGLEQNEVIDVKGNFDYTPLQLDNIDDLIKRATENNFDLNTLKIKQQVDNEFIEIDRSDYWPTISLFGNYKFAGSSDNWDFQNYRSSMIGVNFSLNLFKGGRIAKKVEQSKIASLQTSEQIKNLKDFVTSQVKQKVENLKRVQEEIEALNRNVKLAEKAYKIATVKYKEGTATQLEVKNADVELSLAKTNRIKAINDFVIAKAELDNLIGNVKQNYLKNFNKYLED